jgi:hypothetical protein
MAGSIPDVNADPDYALGSMAAVGGYRSAVGVPILRDSRPIGSIAITRAQAGLALEDLRRPGGDCDPRDISRRRAMEATYRAPLARWRACNCTIAVAARLA